MPLCESTQEHPSSQDILLLSLCRVKIEGSYIIGKHAELLLARQRRTGLESTQKGKTHQPKVTIQPAEKQRKLPIATNSLRSFFTF